MKCQSKKEEALRAYRDGQIPSAEGEEGFASENRRCHGVEEDRASIGSSGAAAI